MLNFCLKSVVAFLTVSLLLIGITDPVFATHQCGNGSCQPSGHHNESCSSCPADCGVCPVPTSTPTPTPEPTSAPTSTPTPTTTPGQPTPTPTPTSDSGSSTPTPTSTSSSSNSSSSSTTSVTYYPSVSLSTRPSNPTNQPTLPYTGSASIEQGNVSQVEFTITDGAQWFPAQFANGTFSFTTPQLSEGVHTIQIRAKSSAGEYTKSESYAKDTVTIITTPPTVALGTFPNITNETTPTITAKASSKLGNITRVEISLDNGNTFLLSTLKAGAYQITTQPLEDGNYQIVARAIDNAGNIGRSKPQTLIVDTIPPIIGGVMQALGPQILIPNSSGKITLVAGAESVIAMSMKGGVTEATIKTSDGEFKLSNQPGTNIWVGKLKFTKQGEKLINILAIDGAGNKTERDLSVIEVKNFGTITDKQNLKPVEGAKVSLFVFESTANSWVLWDAKSYGQQNPQETADKGSYSFMVTPGKYYIEVKASGFHTLQSEIMTTPEIAMLNFDFILRSKPKITLSLPVIGTVVLALPSFSPPDTSPAALSKPQDISPSVASGEVAPEFTLPNLDNEKVSLSSFKGKKMVLTFISPWSPLSLEQAPILSVASKDLSENQAILVVSLQESVPTTQTFMKRGSYSFPVVVDKDGTVGTDFKITVLPQHFFIDATGKIQEIFNGVLSKNELLQKLENMP